MDKTDEKAHLQCKLQSEIAVKQLLNEDLREAKSNLVKTERSVLPLNMSWWLKY